MPEQPKTPEQMFTGPAIEYLARNGYAVTCQTLRYHYLRGRIAARVYGGKQRSLFVFEKAELDRFLREEAPRLKARGQPRPAGKQSVVHES